jgi:hypothetical protein
MTFAGLWDEWKNKATDEVLKSCTMLITEPNDFVAEVHDRMPVVLEAKDFRRGSTTAARVCSSPPPTACCSAGRCQGESIARARPPMIQA